MRSRCRPGDGDEKRNHDGCNATYQLHTVRHDSVLQRMHNVDQPKPGMTPDQYGDDVGGDWGPHETTMPAPSQHAHDGQKPAVLNESDRSDQHDRSDPMK